MKNPKEELADILATKDEELISGFDEMTAINTDDMEWLNQRLSLKDELEENILLNNYI